MAYATKADISNLQNQINNLTGRINNHYAYIVCLQQRCSRLETNVQNLQKALSNLKKGAQ